MMRIVLLATLVALAPASVMAQKKGGDGGEVNYLELASTLVTDGNYDRAEAALQKLDLAEVEARAAEQRQKRLEGKDDKKKNKKKGEEVSTEPEINDLAKYHTVYGIIHLNRSNNELAVKSFDRAIEAGLVRPEVYIYLAQAHFSLQQYQEALDALNSAGERANQLSSTYVMRAQAHWELDQKDQAWAVLTEAQNRFPNDNNLLRRKIFYLVDMGLYQAASDLGQKYLDSVEGSPQDYIVIGNSLRQAGAYYQALKFLEKAALRWPQEVDVLKVLGHTYIEQGDNLAAAEIFFRASLADDQYVAESAELYRRAGKLYRSLTLNQVIRDQEKKLKQRLAILIEMGQYDKVIGMENSLIRVGLLENEDLRYALAYAYFVNGDYDAAEAHLKKLTRADLFRKAAELRRSMEECRAEPYKCV